MDVIPLPLACAPFTFHLPAIPVPNTDPVALFSHLIPEIDKLKPAFIHMVEPRLDANNEVVPYDEAKATNKAFKKLFSGTYITAGG